MQKFGTTGHCEGDKPQGPPLPCAQCWSAPSSRRGPRAPGCVGRAAGSCSEVSRRRGLGVAGRAHCAGPGLWEDLLAPAPGPGPAGRARVAPCDGASSRRGVHTPAAMAHVHAGRAALGPTCMHARVCAGVAEVGPGFPADPHVTGCQAVCIVMSTKYFQPPRPAACKRRLLAAANPGQTPRPPGGLGVPFFSC